MCSNAARSTMLPVFVTLARGTWSPSGATWILIGSGDLHTCLRCSSGSSGPARLRCDRRGLAEHAFRFQLPLEDRAAGAVAGGGRCLQSAAGSRLDRKYRARSRCREAEQGVDDVLLPFGHVADLRKGLGDCIIASAESRILEHLHVPCDERYRSSQLVRDEADKLIFRAREQLQGQGILAPAIATRSQATTASVTIASVIAVTRDESADVVDVIRAILEYPFLNIPNCGKVRAHALHQFAASSDHNLFPGGIRFTTRHQGHRSFEAATTDRPGSGSIRVQFVCYRSRITSRVCPISYAANLSGRCRHDMALNMRRRR